ncbi:MAG: hypothetical protein M1168_03495 [Candidatus Marsarchaeota archaeon]|nr:hypothetical protein [Candidatus Marsarchaeota archaeon]MCL5095018.1 hypothetical protein [Candidatus Marsarchaeota archaeon]
MDKTNKNTKNDKYKKFLRTAITGIAVLGFMGMAAGCAKAPTANSVTKPSTNVIAKKSNQTGGNQSKHEKKLNNMGAGCL